MLADKIKTDLNNSSWIRAMFEEGEKLRALHGAENVFDFSLGNPDYEPPEKVLKELQNLTSASNTGIHRYTSNAGYLDVRELLAKKLSIETALPFTAQNVILTCGAAGGLNVLFKTMLNPGDQVMVLAPYFVEYKFYVENHGGSAVIVSTDSNFEPDIKEMEKNITSACRAIIINSPNNPSGVVYSEKVLQDLAAFVKAKEREYNHPILLISDEPYNKLVYEQTPVPSVMKFFTNCAIVNSFSKSLALPGERIGYIAISPLIEDCAKLMDGLIFSNRVLGFVNAPSLFQKLIANCLDESPPIEEYQKRRDILYGYLTELGFECTKPQGAFYLFPKSPIADDVAFVKHAVQYNLLLVPGAGFASPGYFRISYCTSLDTIIRSKPAFEKLAADFKLK